MHTMGTFRSQYEQWLDTTPYFGDRVLLTMLWDHWLSSMDTRCLLLYPQPSKHIHAEYVKLFIFKEPYEDLFAARPADKDIYQVIDGHKYLELSLSPSGCLAAFGYDHHHCDFYGYPHHNWRIGWHGMQKWSSRQKRMRGSLSDKRNMPAWRSMAAQMQAYGESVFSDNRIVLSQWAIPQCEAKDNHIEDAGDESKKKIWLRTRTVTLTKPEAHVLLKKETDAEIEQFAQARKNHKALQDENHVNQLKIQSWSGDFDAGFIMG